MLDAHESRKDEEQDGCSEYVHRLESAPEEAENDKRKSHYVGVMAQFRSMFKELRQSNLQCICSTLSSRGSIRLARMSLVNVINR